LLGRNLTVFPAFQTEKMPRKSSIGWRAGGDPGLTPAPGHGDFAAMNTAVRKARLWWRTS
jgi:hypothetical protein